MTTTTTNSGFPLALALPGGVTAQHVPGSDPPRYAVDNVAIDIDVRVPDDLGNWHWLGSFLSNGKLCISTDTYPPPLCFDVARRYEMTRAETRAKRPPRQMTLFEEVA